MKKKITRQPLPIELYTIVFRNKKYDALHLRADNFFVQKRDSNSRFEYYFYIGDAVVGVVDKASVLHIVIQEDPICHTFEP